MKIYKNTTQKDFIQGKKQINRCFLCTFAAMILISPNSKQTHQVFWPSNWENPFDDLPAW